ncbi:MAG: hypothetical protein ACPGYV_07275 [Phycisphaeraceae bacterium]
MSCFAATIAVGLYNGNDWQSILSSAVLVAFVALVVGMVAGSVMLRCVNDQIDKHRSEHPIPDETTIGETNDSASKGELNPS